MSTDALSPRPFRSLGAKPFLALDAAALAALQAEFHKRSRLFHPDRFINAPESARLEAEARSSELNADYAVLRDAWNLIDAVLRDETPNAAGARRGPPPELAEDYFDLQEKAMELPPERLRGDVRALLQKVSAGLQNSEAAALELTRKFPFSGFGDAAAPWTEDDLARLREAVHKVRYYRSFERDIRAKFPD